MSQQISEEISNLGKRLVGRLEEDYVSAALDYVAHGENLMALDTLAGYVEEFAVLLEKEELAEFLRLAALFNAAQVPPFINLQAG